jgi:hypothetical protein
MKKLIAVSLFVIVAAGMTAFDVLNDTGQAGYCGSPSESYCTNCHSGSALNSGGGSVAISGAPAMYQLGQTYTISVTVTQANRSLFGFAMEALTTPGNANAGTLVITNTAETQVLTATNTRKAVTHKFNGGATPNAHTFTFNWTAPSSNVGAVKLWAVGNACNGNGASSGDLVYSTNFTISAPVGVDDAVKDAFSMRVFPNPSQGPVFIEYTLETAGETEAYLESMDGKTIASLFRFSQPAGRHQELITLPAGLPSGTYFIHFGSGGKKTVKKLMVH